MEIDLRFKVTSGSVLSISCLKSPLLTSSLELRFSSAIDFSLEDPFISFPTQLLDSITAEMPRASLPFHSSQKNFQSFSEMIVKTSA